MREAQRGAGELRVSVCSRQRMRCHFARGDKLFRLYGPEDYLNGFEPDAAAKQRDVAEPHPWRRYFARGIDLALVGLPVSFVQYVLLHRNYNRFPVGGHRLRSDRLGIAAPPSRCCSRASARPPASGAWCIVHARRTGERQLQRSAEPNGSSCGFTGAGLGLAACGACV